MSDKHDFDPNKARDSIIPMAALVGIDEESIEILTLYLEITGWRCIVGTSVAGLAINSSHLVFIDEGVFRNDLLPEIAKYRDDLPFCLNRSVAEDCLARQPSALFDNPFGIESRREDNRTHLKRFISMAVN